MSARTSPAGAGRTRLALQAVQKLANAWSGKNCIETVWGYVLREPPTTRRGFRHSTSGNQR
jgi:hypothetical protein